MTKLAAIMFCGCALFSVSSPAEPAPRPADIHVECRFGTSVYAWRLEVSAAQKPVGPGFSGTADHYGFLTKTRYLCDGSYSQSKDVSVLDFECVEEIAGGKLPKIAFQLIRAPSGVFYYDLSEHTLFDVCSDI